MQVPTNCAGRSVIRTPLRGYEAGGTNSPHQGPSPQPGLLLELPKATLCWSNQAAFIGAIHLMGRVTPHNDVPS